LFPPDDERLSLETCRGGKINTLKKVKKCVKLVENPQTTDCLVIYIQRFEEKRILPYETCKQIPGLHAVTEKKNTDGH
jgi:hypothetical protein